MKRSFHPLSFLVTPLLFTAFVGLLHAQMPLDPLFDWDAILKEPTETVVLSEDRTNGLVFRTLEFTSRRVDGKPERIQGIFAFVEGNAPRPGLFWSMGGMAAANRHFPGIFAQHGWTCLAITLPHPIRNSFTAPFNTRNPAEANLTLLARDQLRGITVLAQQPETDPNRLAVAGASYGGVFATLIAGADPRIKAGMSFFGGGRHALGTSLPQFLHMDSLDGLAVWNRTIDPAFRLAQRSIPFIWGIAFNDHWFHFPAVTRTFLEAAGPDKRLIIMPHWQHGFPPHVDETLIRFLDTTPIAPLPLSPFNAPGPIHLRLENEKILASFEWTGVRPVTNAQIIASYGEYTPWLGWPHRAAFVFPALVTNQTAVAILPIPSRRLPLVVWGTITDANQFSTSTAPLLLETNALASYPITTSLSLNAFPFERFDEAMLSFYRGCGDTVPGEIGWESEGNTTAAVWRLPPTQNKKEPDLALAISLFHHVPGVAHRLSIRLKANPPSPLAIGLYPKRPSQWRFPLVRQLIEQDPRLAPLLAGWETPPQPLITNAPVSRDWTDFSLDIPVPIGPIDGYRFEIRQAPSHQSLVTIRSIRMEPLWPEP